MGREVKGIGGRREEREAVTDIPVPDWESEKVATLQGGHIIVAGCPPRPTNSTNPVLC